MKQEKPGTEQPAFYVGFLMMALVVYFVLWLCSADMTAEIVGTILLGLVLYGCWWGEHRKPKALKKAEMRKAIAQAEVDLNLPIITHGECWNCKKPLVVDAKNCAYCGVTSKKPARVCPKCQTRLFEDAFYCHECGEKVGMGKDPNKEMVYLDPRTGDVIAPPLAEYMRRGYDLMNKTRF